jgi:hypothetical protein
LIQNHLDRGAKPLLVPLAPLLICLHFLYSFSLDLYGITHIYGNFSTFTESVELLKHP